jgi:hypothetical protein
VASAASDSADLVASTSAPRVRGVALLRRGSPLEPGLGTAVSQPKGVQYYLPSGAQADRDPVDISGIVDLLVAFAQTLTAEERILAPRQ